MFNKKRLSLSNNIAFTFFICFGFSILAIILLSLLSAAIANISNNPTYILGPLSLGTLIVSGIGSGLFSSKIKKKGNPFFASLVALATIILMLIICVIINGKIPPAALLNYFCYIGIATITSLLSLREKTHRHKR